MMQRLVDSALGVAKESAKTLSQESFNNFVKLVNGFSALVLAVLPGKANALEAVTGWEEYPTFRAPRLPKWMEEGVSSFNRYIPDFDFDSSETDEESEYATDTEDDDSVPASPCSQTSRLSRSNSLNRVGTVRRSSFLRRLFRRLTWPIRFVLRFLRISGWYPSGNLTPSSSGSSRGGPGTLRRTSGSNGSLKNMFHAASKHFTDMKDLVVNHRTTDSRRRGIVEDLQLGVELFIEKVFEVVRRWIHYFLSPLETLKAILRRIFFLDPPKRDSDTVVVPTATLGDSTASLKTDRRYAQQPLNTDARTCGDFITAMGYPYESFKVTTADGYILALERIPRPESKEVLYLQHGILDSSLGWVSCGVVGSQAFAAYDQGFDVFLGNFRGLASRDHVNKHISSQRYWRYSVNEHGTQDIPAMLNKVHDLKMNELKDLNLLKDSAGSSSEMGSVEKLPYSLCGVSHSLGGAAMLIYIVTRRLEGKPHYLKRAILLSPSGFHDKAPPTCKLLQYAVPILAPLIRPIFPGLYIPTKFFRMLFNKLSRDFQNYPALGGLVQTLISYTVGGDSSNWIGAFGMTHYNMEDMPGIALGVALHLAQMMRSGRFTMYDFGSRAANIQAYGTPQPLDVGANYEVIDIPIDVVAGKKDKLIPKSMILRHYQVLKDAGVKASYSEFDYAHLDFTFSNKDEVLEYVMSRLMLVQPKRSKFKRKYHRSKTLREAKRKGLNQGFEGDTELNRNPSHSRSKSFSTFRHSEDAEYELEHDHSGSGSGSITGVSISTYGDGSMAELAQDSLETSPEEAESSRRSSSERLQRRLGKTETEDRMSYQDAHAAAFKFVNEFPKSGFAVKDVINSLRGQSSESKIPTLHSSSPIQGSENLQQSRLSMKEGNHSKPSKIQVENGGSIRPSNLGRLRIPGCETCSSPSSSSIRGVRYRNGAARTDH